MLIKWETKSFRVKGLSFHPKRPWILASLHNGHIQLWDYQLNSCLEKFEGHDGPVRGIDFHCQQPLFVSGGDDYRVKVWNYQQRKSIFTLTGHMDYVRTTFFHLTQPWIVSASDDQTSRIWNWQSRTSICILTGHNHYVMCAQFHPSENLVISASLDQTVRVWDITGLVKRYSSAPALGNTGGNRSSSGFSGLSSGSSQQVELFGESNAVVRHVLEGHERGVNWATFHPTLPLIVSSSDDRSVKLWRMTEDKVWEISTMRGHYNNVSCAIFFPNYSTILSNSEDKSIRVWDVARRVSIHTFRRDTDRFWILTTHPTSNLIAAGHDSGIVLFKLERERPAWSIHENFVFYVKERHVRRLDTSTGTDKVIMKLRGPFSGGAGGELGEARSYYGSLAYNPAEHSILVTSRSNLGSVNKIDYYELYQLPNLEEADNSRSCSKSPRIWKKSTCKNAVWIGRNRFAVLVDQNQIVLKNLKNEVIRKIHLSFQIDNISYAGVGMLLLHEPEHISLFDVQSKRRMARLRTPHFETKMVVWSKDMKYLALVGKRSVTLCSKDLTLFGTWSEILKVKSGVWDESKRGEGIFIYNTCTHLKYGLISGDHGIIRTLDVSIYLIKICDEKLVCFDKETKIHCFTIDPTEYKFKLALYHRDYDHVIQVVKSSKLVGQASVAYLRDKGYPEVALYFVKDPQTKFSLALECCNVEVALECAKALDSPPYWEKLAQMALLLGNHQVVEMCYKRTRNFSKLAFLYVITGNLEKLRRIQKIATGAGGKDKDISSVYLVSLLLGEVEERVRLLEKSGRDSLAYYTARTHGLIEEGEMEDKAESSRKAFRSLTEKEIRTIDQVVDVEGTNRKLLGGCMPLLTLEENWPLLNTFKGAFDSCPASLGKPTQVHLDANPVGAWIDGDDVTIFEEIGDGEDLIEGFKEAKDYGKSDWEVGSDVDLSSELNLHSCSPSELDQFYSVPSRGIPVQLEWTSMSQIVADHVSSGSFETAFQLLQSQLGVVNGKPFKEMFMQMYSKSRVVYTPLANQPMLSLYPVTFSKKDGKSFPINGIYTVEHLSTVKLKQAYDHVTQGKFQEAVDVYKQILLQIPLTVVETKCDVTKAHGLITLCREYILGLQMELHRKLLPKECLDEQIRSCELAAYLTHMKLDSVHLILALRTAMNLNFKLRNFKVTASFCRRLLELGPKPEMAQQTRRILQICEKSSSPGLPQDENPILGYDEHNPFTVCAKSYEAIYRGSPDVTCTFCGAKYKPEYDQTVCTVCDVSLVGKSGSGLKICRFR